MTATDPTLTLRDDAAEAETLRTYASRGDGQCAVVGAYKGATMKYLLTHGADYVYGTEPQGWAREIAKHNLDAAGYADRYTLDDVALGPWATEPGSLILLHGYFTDGARAQPYPADDSRRESRLVRTMNVSEWLDFTGMLDLCVLNCEGAEYTLFPYLEAVSNRMIVQFHGNGPVMYAPGGVRLRPVSVGADWWVYGC